MTDILCAILGFLQMLVEKIFPNLSVSSDSLASISDAFNMMVTFIAQVNFIIPLPTMFTIFSLVYSIKIAKFSVFIVNWVIRRFRGG